MIIVTFQVTYLTAQVAINYDGSEPTTHTLLDLKSDTTGLLIPRMSHVQMNVLGGKLDNSHKGMIIYNSNAKTIYFWDGSEFVYMQSGTISQIRDDDYDTYIDTDLGADPDEIHIATGGTVYWTFDDGIINISNTGNSIFIGENAGLNDDLSDNNNVFLGHDAGKNNTSGYKNVAIGSDALFSSIHGNHNIAIGSSTLYNLTNGVQNVSIGYESSKENTMGHYNTSIGSYSMHKNTTGENNVVLGYGAGYYIDGGDNNVMIGYRAGRGGSENAKSGNVFVGYEAGYNEEGDNKLYIQNSSSSDPLIYGDFDLSSLGFMGDVGIGTKTPMVELQVHSIANSLSSLYITPKVVGSGDSSMILLAEDHNATYGMYWMYDGAGNEMELWGKSSATYNGPHLLVKRDNGDVAIGSEFASGYKLSVDGKVICEELRVNLLADWPDYVFSNDYNLMPILDVETYINEKGHLPNIPAASEIEKSGLEVGETQRLMMEKIEELTLYIIEQQKQIDELKKNQ